MSHAAQNVNPQQPPYRDRKRYAWILSLLVPCLVGFGPLLMVTTGDVRALWFPVVFFYVFAPLLDWLLGEDLSNPPESAVPALDADPYYRWITFMLVPILWAAFVFSAWFVVHFDLPLHGRDSRTILLQRLTEIREHGWHPSIKLNKLGQIQPYKARNGGGYTLEALLGIIPNGRAEPDYLGWEIKAHSTSRITLMTPEPTGGFYGERGVKAFVTEFGSPTANDTLYFTGTHRAGSRNKKTKLCLEVRGFNTSRGVIDDVNGAVELLTDSGICAAAWSFSDLMIGWNKKHAQAAYVSYESEKVLAPAYRYFSPALLGEGTDFNRYLVALSDGLIIFDPGSKVMNASSEKSTVKARSQFRTSVKHLAGLYETFGPAGF